MDTRPHRAQPLRIAWFGRHNHFSGMSVKVVRYWMERHGAQTVDLGDNPDLVCATCAHPRDYSTMRMAAAAAKKAGAPLLVGGHDAYCGASLLAWADYVCVGEGFRLAEGLATEGATDPRGYLDAAPNVLSRDDPDREVTPDYHVPFVDVPVVKTAPRAYYSLAGRGCHRKCTFCFTSWAQPHQTVDRAVMERNEAAVKAAQPDASAIWVTNDEGAGHWSGSITVRRLLDGYLEDWPNVVRVGIEGLTEQRRRAFGKPISDSDVAALLELAHTKRRQLQLFFIVGLPDDPPGADAFEPLLEHIDADPQRHPRVWLKFTHHEPAPHTPLGRWDIGSLQAFDGTAAAASMRARLGRIRSFTTARVGTAAWAGIARRMPHDKLAWWAQRRWACGDMSVRDVCRLATDHAGTGVVDGTGAYPWQRVRTRIRL